MRFWAMTPDVLRQSSLGHEASGTIIGGPRDGTLVTINPLNGCGTCPACVAGKSNICADRQIISMPPRPGAFADMVADSVR